MTSPDGSLFQRGFSEIVDKYFVSIQMPNDGPAFGKTIDATEYEEAKEKYEQARAEISHLCMVHLVKGTSVYHSKTGLKQTLCEISSQCQEVAIMQVAQGDAGDLPACYAHKEGSIVR